MFNLIKKISIFVFVIILFSPKTYAFTDLTPNHQYYKSIKYFENLGIINGYPDGSFKAEKNISRAEISKILVLTLKTKKFIDKTRNQMPHDFFYDVKIDDWFEKYISIAYRYGFIKGYKNKTFKPSKKINFAEALKIILESNMVDLSNVNYKKYPLLNIKKGDWFFKYFAYAYEHKLINQKKYYNPSVLITRGEFLNILYNLRAEKEGFKKNNNYHSNEYSIYIPKLNIVNTHVSMADIYDVNQSLSVLKKGLGVYLSTPDKFARSIIFGHSSGYSWDKSIYKEIFRKINKLSFGDLIYINYNEKAYVYKVSSTKIIKDENLKKVVMNTKNKDDLVLYTCWPPDHIYQRYLVYTKRVNLF